MGRPLGNKRRSPGQEDWVTVVFTTTDVATDGTPHCPRIMKKRCEFADRAGPP